MRKRNESIEFENREKGVVKIQKMTKRRDSVKRQFNFPQTNLVDKKNNQQQQSKPMKGFHRKG